MTKIYVVKAYGGSYDDAWENNLYAVGDEDRAKEEVARLERIRAECGAVWPEVRAVLQDGYARLHELPQIKLPPEPKGPAKPNKQLLAEFKQKYAEWRKQCEPIWKEINRVKDEVFHEAVVASLNKAQTLGCTDEHLQSLGFYDVDEKLRAPRFNSDTNYCYEELELR